MTGRNVATPAPAAAAELDATEPGPVDRWDREAGRSRPTWCRDRECRLPLVQPERGRPRRYCDATCRKNAARRREWEAYDSAMDLYWQEDAAAEREHQAAVKAWESEPYLDEPAWMDEARAAGWTPPHWYERTRARPMPLRRQVQRPEPPAGSRPRMGARGEAWWL